MCGIAGIYSEVIPIELQLMQSKRMLDTISHRGPDHTSVWQHPFGITLGHNRLSILDLSDAANQPFHYLGLSIVFNGEIYNYIELRNELLALGYQFKTQSDTEVLLAAYHLWGERCVSKLVGMWAFVIFNQNTKSIFASRDRFGIKPLYYVWDHKSFQFASEYKALKTIPEFRSELNLDHLYRYVQMGLIDFGSETFWKQIEHLPAGHNLVIENGHLRISQYWDIEFRQSSFTPQEAIEIFRDKMLESVNLHLRSDVVVGACLSGGIDSSSIASIVGKFHPETKFNTYTLFYDGKNDVDERPFAREVTNLYPNLKPHYLMPSDAEIAAAFDMVQYHMDTPIPGSSPISQYFVMKLAKSHGAIVLLDGQGSDEYLGGYLHSFYRHIADGLFSTNPMLGFKRWNDFCQIQNFNSKERILRLSKSLATGIFNEASIYHQEYLHAHPFLPLQKNDVLNLKAPQGNKLNQFLYNLVFKTSLPTLLHFEDRNSMAFSIESRVPFLDHRLVEFAFSLPDSLKINKGVTKYILRESMRGIIPDPIANRMDKKGFVTPGEVKWLRGPLKFLLEEVNYSNLNMLSTSKTKKIIEEYKKGDNSNAKLVWRIATLNRWLG